MSGIENYVLHSENPVIGLSIFPYFMKVTFAMAQNAWIWIFFAWSKHQNMAFMEFVTKSIFGELHHMFLFPVNGASTIC